MDDLNQLQQRLYYLYAQQQAANNNVHNENMGIINFINNQLEKVVDDPKGTEYIIRIVNSLPKGMIKNGSGIFNSLLNKLNNIMPEMHLKGYNYCGPFTKLDKRLARGDKSKNKLDACCKEHDIFYRDNEATKERHAADKELERVADERIHASDADYKEKADAVVVKAAMKSKRFFCMGVRY